MEKDKTELSDVDSHQHCSLSEKGDGEEGSGERIDEGSIGE